MKLTKEMASGINIVIEDLHSALNAVGVESSIHKDAFKEGDEFTQDDMDNINNVESNARQLAEWFDDIDTDLIGEVRE